MPQMIWRPLIPVCWPEAGSCGYTHWAIALPMGFENSRWLNRSASRTGRIDLRVFVFCIQDKRVEAEIKTDLGIIIDDVNDAAVIVQNTRAAALRA